MEAPAPGSRLADRLAALSSANSNVSKLRERRLALQSKPKTTDYDILLQIVKSSKTQDQVNGPWKKQLETAIEGGRNVNFINESTGKTILHDACAECSLEVVAFLLRSGADPTFVTRQNRSTLYYASLNKDPKVSERILAFSDDPDARLIERDNQQMTPFDMACLSANAATAQWLYTQYPRKELEKSRELDRQNRTTLHLLLTGSTANETQLRELNDFIKVIMKAKPGYIWRRDDEERTPLAVHVANHFKDAILMTFHTVLTQLASPEKVDTALYMLSNSKWKPKGAYEPEKWLLLQKLCLNPHFPKFMPAALTNVSDRAIFAQDPSGRSILHWFALYGHTSTFIDQVLSIYSDFDNSVKSWRHPLGLNMPPPTQYGAKMARYNSFCWSALLLRESVVAAIAKMKGHAIDFDGPDSQLRIVDANRDTPLHIAAKFNNFGAIETLEGVFPGEGKTWKDAQGRTALHVAALSDSGAAIASLVHTVRCDLEERDSEGYTPLMLALREKRAVAASVLVQLKAASQDCSATDGTTIESLTEAFDQHVEALKAKKEEARKARLAAQAEEDAETEAEDSEEEKPTPNGSTANGEHEKDGGAEDETGSVEYNGSDSGSVNSMEEIDSDLEITSPVANGKFRPKIKLDSEYDEDEASKTDEEPAKPLVVKNGGPAKPVNGRPALTRKPRINITHTDDYSHSSDDDETGSTGSVEIHSDSAESPPASPRSIDSLPSPRSPEPTPKSPEPKPFAAPKDDTTLMDDKTKSDLEARISALEAAKTDLESALSTSKQECTAKIEELEKTKESEATLKKRVDELQDRVTERSAELSEKESKISELLSSSQSQGAETAEFEAQIASLSQSLSEAQKALETSSSTSKASSDLAESNLSESKAKLDEALAKLEKLEKSQQLTSSASQESDAKALSLEQELNSVRKQLTGRQEAVSNLESSMSSLSSEKKQLESSNSQHLATIEQLKLQLEASASALSMSQSAARSANVIEPESDLQHIHRDSERTIQSSQASRAQAHQNALKKANAASNPMSILTLSCLAMLVLAALFAFLLIVSPDYDQPQQFYFS